MVVDYSNLKTVKLRDRKHKVSVLDFAKPRSGFFDLFPNILAAKSLKDTAEKIANAKASSRGIIWACGAHVIKCGLSPILARLMEDGYITHIALNGAGIIHDFEIAYCGETSECVEESIRDGSFGMAEETSEILGKIICSDSALAFGIGDAVGEYASQLPFSEFSLLAQAYKHSVPVSIHPALGTDVLHYHPSVDWGLFAKAARIDFDKFVEAVSSLNNGGVYLNVGSAVILPEVFLKSLSILRNLGHTVEDFTSVVFDMIDHYRPRENVARRPGGNGHVIIGHHEIMIPLLVEIIYEKFDPFSR